MSMMNGSVADSVRPVGTGGTMLPQVRSRMRLSPDRISRTVLTTVYGDGQPRSSMRYLYHESPPIQHAPNEVVITRRRRGTQPRSPESGVGG
jgi:hypothetical protein